VTCAERARPGSMQRSMWRRCWRPSFKADAPSCCSMRKLVQRFLRAKRDFIGWVAHKDGGEGNHDETLRHAPGGQLRRGPASRSRSRYRWCHCLECQKRNRQHLRRSPPSSARGPGRGAARLKAAGRYRPHRRQAGPRVVFQLLPELRGRRSIGSLGSRNPISSPLAGSAAFRRSSPIFPATLAIGLRPAAATPGSVDQMKGFGQSMDPEKVEWKPGRLEDIWNTILQFINHALRGVPAWVNDFLRNSAASRQWQGPLR